MFVKLFQQILDSSIADNRRLRHFFTDLLLCADSSGMVMMTPHAIARRIGADVEEVLWGLAELEKPDPMSKTTDHEGRRIERVEGHGYGWRILNYEHYRAMRDAEQMRESTRERVRRHRSKVSHVTHVTPCNVTKRYSNASNAMQKEKQMQKEKEKEEDGDKSPASPVLNPENDPPSKPTPRASTAIPAPTLPFASAAFAEQWAKWVRHRKEIKKPLTPTQITEQLKDMQKIGEARSISMMAYTIGKGWQGLREPDREPQRQHSVLGHSGIIKSVL